MNPKRADETARMVRREIKAYFDECLSESSKAAGLTNSAERAFADMLRSQLAEVLDPGSFTIEILEPGGQPEVRTVIEVDTPYSFPIVLDLPVDSVERQVANMGDL